MVIFLIILVALVAVNVWATRRVIATPDEWGVPKRMLLAGIWIIPFIGALIAKSHAPAPIAYANVARTRSVIEQPEAPVRLTISSSAEFNVGDHLAVFNGVPVLDWRALAKWAQACDTPKATNAAMEHGRRAWLLHLRDALGPEAHLYSTDESHILSTLEPNEANAIAQYISTARHRISQVLGGLAHFPLNERSILVVFDSEEDYYQYISIYYPSQGEFAFSGGMYINAGCPHFVVVRTDLSSVEPVIAHELTHSAVAHLHLPKWLDEGLAVNTEYRVASPRKFLYTPQELHRMHLKFWTAERIQEFWSGASFDRTDDGNLLSYELARIIVEQMAKQWDKFAAFVAAANREDSGASSAQTNMSIRLGTFAAALLEVVPTESWEPAHAAHPARDFQLTPMNLSSH
jgi:hypothetical protein